MAGTNGAAPATAAAASEGRKEDALGTQQTSSRTNSANPDRQNVRPLDAIAADIHAAERRSIFDIGDLLLEARAACKHGGWLHWLYEEFEWSDDTAGRYMKVAELATRFRKLRNLRLAKSTLYDLADEAEDKLPGIIAELAKHATENSSSRDAAAPVIWRARALLRWGDFPNATLVALDNLNDWSPWHAEAVAALTARKPETDDEADAIVAAIVEASAMELPATSNEESGAPARAEWHVCWQCKERGLFDPAQQRSYPGYGDADIWLHDSCIAAFEAEEAARAAATDSEPAGGMVTGVAMSPHAERGLDLYETPAAAVRALLEVEPLAGTIWEPACGPGAIVGVLRAAGHHVVATDIESYGCPDSLGTFDFLKQTTAPMSVQTILTNPPFMRADEFVRHALTLVPRVIMLMRLAFIESEGRSDILDGGQLARVHVFRNRLMMHRANWDGPKISSGAIAFAWFVWERDHSGPTELHRISWQPGDDELPAAGQEDDFAIPGFLDRQAAP